MAPTPTNRRCVAWPRCEQGDPDGFLALCSRLRIDPKSGDVTTNDDLQSWPSYPLLDIDHEVLQASAEPVPARG